MEINMRQKIARHRINKISTAVQTAIDKLCEESNYDITYAEINAAMLQVMGSFNGYELRALWDKPEKNKAKK